MPRSMEQANIAVVEAFNRAWMAGDLEGALDHCTPDVVFMLHLDADIVEHAGCWVGRDEVRTALSLILKNFEFESYQPTLLGAEGEIVRQHVDWTGHHKSSGERMSLHFRHVIVVRKGLMFQVEEFHDAAKLRALMSLISSGATR